MFILTTNINFHLSIRHNMALEVEVFWVVTQCTL